MCNRFASNAHIDLVVPVTMSQLKAYDKYLELDYPKDIWTSSEYSSTQAYYRHLDGTYRTYSKRSSKHVATIIYLPNNSPMIDGNILNNGTHFLKPIVSPTSFTYDGNSHSPTIRRFEPSVMSQNGIFSASDVGDYTIKFALNDTEKYSWLDNPAGENADVEYTWTISPPSITYINIPTISPTNFPYDGDVHSPIISGFDPSKMSKTGVTSASVLGNYTITFTLNDTSKYNWSNNPMGDTATVECVWSISDTSVSVPVPNKELVYNGLQQTMTFSNSSCFDISGDTGTNAGDYYATVTPKTGYCWTDKTYAPIKVRWTIERKRIKKPYYTNKLVYNGSEQRPIWQNYDKTELDISGDLDGVHAGKYFTVFTPTANYQWSDENYEPFSIEWEIDKYHFTYPFQAENRDPGNPRMYYPDISKYLVYNGAEQSPTLWFGNIYNHNLVTGVIEKAFTVEGDSSAVSVGVYTMRLTPDEDHCWANGSSEPYNVAWQIVKQKLINPSQNAKGLEIPSPRGEQYYTGEVIYPEFDNYNPNILDISGETSGIDIGSYVVYFDIKDKDNYEWTDGRIDKVSVTWQIIEAPKLVNYPYQSNYLIYNGKCQSPEWENYDSNAMILVGGTPREINIGKYQVQFSLKNGYAWIDNKTTNAIATWSINKIKIIRPSVHGTDRNGNGGQYYELNGKRYPVWDNYNPDVMIMNGDTYAIDNSLHIPVVTLKQPDIYEWDDGTSNPLEVKWRLDTPYDPNTGGGEPIFPGRKPSNPDDGDAIIRPGVVNIDPYDIPRLISDGDYTDRFHIGDKFPIELNGVVGGVEFKNAYFYVFIIGFDHNSEIENKKSIHFQFAKSLDNGREIAFTDKYYGQFGEGKGFCMNKSDSAKGGWMDSYMRTTICKQFYNALPEAWRKIIIPCPKYTDNMGDGKDSPNSVTMTKDKIFLLSEYECIGRNVSSNHAEDNYQKQYEYYKRNGFKGKGKYNSPNENVSCWLRSPSHSSDSHFCSVLYSPTNSSGGCAGEFPMSSLGFTPCFAVGESGSSGTGGDYDPDNPSDDTTGTGVKRVHIPRQINPSYEDGSAKSPQWDEYDDNAIINLGGEWNGISAGTYYVILKLNPGYIWEDSTTEIKTVPWKILATGEPMPFEPSPIKVHIPKQINPPHFDGYFKTPEWDEWNRFAIDIIGGTEKAVPAGEYRINVKLLPGYVWEDGTTEDKILPWIILPVGAKSPDDSSGDPDNSDKPEIIEQDKPIPDNPIDEEYDDNLNDYKNGNCCCCCDTGLFDKLNACDCDDGFTCDCTKDIEI